MPTTNPLFGFGLTVSFALAASLALGSIGESAHAQQTKSSVFSKLPTTQQPNAQQKRRLGSARTYAEKQRIKKQLTGARGNVANPRTSLVPGLNNKPQAQTGAARKTQGRAFGARQRIRAQSKQRGGQPAK
jgi:hypothetical protein